MRTYPRDYYNSKSTIQLEDCLNYWRRRKSNHKTVSMIILINKLLQDRKIKRYAILKKMTPITKDSIVKSLRKRGNAEYKNGAIHAMSIAVNQYNVPDYIRDGVFEIMKIKI